MNFTQSWAISIWYCKY